MVNLFKGEFNVGLLPVQELISSEVLDIPEVPQSFSIQYIGHTHDNAKKKDLDIPSFTKD